MRKFIQIAATTSKEYLAYRLNFILWRLRRLLSLLVIFFLWFSIFEKQSQFGLYSKEILLSYILYSNFVSDLTLSSRVAEIAELLNSGGIINILLKPVSLFFYYFTRDIADKSINAGFAVCEILLVIILFKPPIIFPQHIPLFLPFLFMGIGIAFFINMILSFVGFWTTEVWAPRFLFYMLVSFLAGTYFPLDLLPKGAYTILMLTPFPYIFYIPTKILIGQIASIPAWHIAVSVGWVFVLFKTATIIWKNGNKNFSFWGR